MIHALIESAFATGYLSVESEGLLHQVIMTKSYQLEDLKALKALYEAVQAGRIKREASANPILNLPHK